MDPDARDREAALTDGDVRLTAPPYLARRDYSQ
jgi:hypothetical protein